MRAAGSESPEVDLSVPASLVGVSESSGGFAVQACRRLIAVLLELGVDTVFSAEAPRTVEPIDVALEEQTAIRHVRMTSAHAAVHAAIGYARSTGRVGVVVLAAGTGAAGLIDALHDSVPIVCISGQRTSAKLEATAGGEFVQVGISRLHTKWSTRVRRGRWLEPSLRRAFHVAQQCRPGPALVEVPVGAQLEWLPHVESYGNGVASAASAPSPRLVRQAVALLLKATRPLLLGGGGLVHAGDVACAAFTDLARRTGAPCALTMMGLGAVSPTHSRYLGMVGRHGHLAANLALERADVVLGLGTRMMCGSKLGFAELATDALLIQVNVDSSTASKAMGNRMALVGDCAQVLMAMLEEVDALAPDHERLNPWKDQIESWRVQGHLRIDDALDRIGHALLASLVGAFISRRDVVVCADTGRAQMDFVRHFSFEQPRRWLASGGAGTPGRALPMAIGAQLAHPGRRVVCITDHTSATSHLQEFATVAHLRLPLKVLVVSEADRGFGNVAIPVMASGVGWWTRRVRDRSDLDDAMRHWFDAEGPACLEVVLSPPALPR